VRGRIRKGAIVNQIIGQRQLVAKTQKRNWLDNVAAIDIKNMLLGSFFCHYEKGLAFEYTSLVSSRQLQHIMQLYSVDSHSTSMTLSDSIAWKTSSLFLYVSL
jgi:hypothetical protein